MSSLEFRKPEKNEPVPETIKAAALLWKGEKFTGVTHADAFLKFSDIHPEVKERPEFEEGFETSMGRFIDRQEAMQIAEHNEQIWQGTRLDKNFGLRSEDLH